MKEISVVVQTIDGKARVIGAFYKDENATAMRDRVIRGVAVLRLSSYTEHLLGLSADDDVEKLARRLGINVNVQQAELKE